MSERKHSIRDRLEALSYIPEASLVRRFAPGYFPRPLAGLMAQFRKLYPSFHGRHGTRMLIARVTRAGGA